VNWLFIRHNRSIREQNPVNAIVTKHLNLRRKVAHLSAPGAGNRRTEIRRISSTYP